MKRTTYILIGLLVGGLLILIGGMVILSFFGNKTMKNAISLDGERVEMKLDGVHAVKMYVSKNADSDFNDTNIKGEITVTNSFEGEERFVSFPKSEYLNVSRRNDTLFVELDLKSKEISDKCVYSGCLYLEGFDLQLSVDTTLNSISTNLRNVRLHLKGMSSDSLLIRAAQDVVLDSCRFRSLDIDGEGFWFMAKNSKIENFYLNLDGVYNWTFENTEIDTEFLTGSNTHQNDLKKGECRRVVWSPKTEEAELRITLSEKSVIDITP